MNPGSKAETVIAIIAGWIIISFAWDWIIKGRR